MAVFVQCSMFMKDVDTGTSIKAREFHYFFYIIAGAGGEGKAGLVDVPVEIRHAERLPLHIQPEIAGGGPGSHG